MNTIKAYEYDDGSYMKIIEIIKTSWSINPPTRINHLLRTTRPYNSISLWYFG